jgi:hypothetical protein
MRKLLGTFLFLLMCALAATRFAASQMDVFLRLI